MFKKEIKSTISPSLFNSFIGVFLFLFAVACATKAPEKKNSDLTSRDIIQNPPEIIIQENTQQNSSTSSASSAEIKSEVLSSVPENIATVRTVSVWLESIGTDAYLQLGFLQELEKQFEIVSVYGTGFGCWVAMSWASENKGSYAEWQSFKWDSWDVLGANLLNRVVGRATSDAFRARLETRLPLKSKDKFKIPMSCPYIFKGSKDFQDSRDLAVHDDLWIQMRNTFYFPLMDLSSDEKKSAFFRDAPTSEELLKMTPANVKPEEHMWVVLSSEAIRKELRHNPYPDVQKGIIDNVRWVKKVLAPGKYGLVQDVKELKKRRNLLLQGRKDGKAFFLDPNVLKFIGFGIDI